MMGKVQKKINLYYKFGRKNKKKILINSIGYLLFVLLGAAPQLLQNAIFAETPVFYEILEEGSLINQYIVAAFMTANVVTIGYFLIRYCIKIPDLVSMAIILGVSIYVSILTGIWWDKTWNNHSFAIIMFSFLAATVGNTSVLVFFPYVSSFKPIYTTSLSVGFGLSGFIALILSLIQNVANVDNLNFSTNTYFYLTSLFIIILSVPYFILGFTSFSDHLKPRKVFSNDSFERDFSLKYDHERDIYEPVIMDEDVYELRKDPLLDPEVATLPSPDGSRININASSITYSVTYFNEEDDEEEEEEEEEEEFLSNISLNLIRSKSRIYTNPNMIKKLIIQALPTQAAMFWVSFMLFFLPGVFPFLSNDDDTTFMILNYEFLILTSIGAGLSGFKVLQFSKYLFIPIIVHTVLFFIVIFPVFSFTYNIISVPNFITITLVGFLTLLSGYNQTLIYLGIQNQVKEKKITVSNVQTLYRFAGLVSQISGMFVVLVNIFIISLNGYHEVSSSSESSTS
eukprot:TRINITY_DN2103_c0_g6_i1.p1 TRINITY_DN2103_c0_g6~~TRINITY_DN2103_c0_g6_i1.p1  ORF type:complete len:512 (+),score=92.53 TRINITY_DN2103_c0_g6_i1:43-1578(+)